MVPGGLRPPRRLSGGVLRLPVVAGLCAGHVPALQGTGNARPRGGQILPREDSFARWNAGWSRPCARVPPARTGDGGISATSGVGGGGLSTPLLDIHDLVVS